MTFQIGSHDSMTYATPEKWYFRPFHFIARTQSKTYKEQYEDYGIRLFDMRIRWDDKAQTWKFSHGMITFKTEPVEDVFKWLNSKKDCIIRLVLEYNKPVKNMDEITEKFIEACDKWTDIYKNIIWFEFTRKYDWKKLYTYDREITPSIYQAISSMTSLWSSSWSWLDDWYPYLYARLQNKDNICQGTTADYMLLDFIEIR